MGLWTREPVRADGFPVLELGIVYRILARTAEFGPSREWPTDEMLLANRRHTVDR